MIWKCACAYIVLNLLEDTGTASTSLAYVKVIHIGVESVLQNCFVGRCANLHIATFPLLHFFERTQLDQNLLVKFWTSRSSNGKQSHNSKQPTATKLPTQESTQAMTHSQQTRKAPLLPTPPTPARQHRNSTFPRPSPLNNNRFHQQHFPRPFCNQQLPLLPLPLHQIPPLPRAYQHAPGHLIPQASTYLPVLLPYPSHLITSLQYIHAA